MAHIHAKALLRSGTQTLVMDISALERLSSSTVSVLLWAQRRGRARGVVLVTTYRGGRC